MQHNVGVSLLVIFSLKMIEKHILNLSTLKRVSLLQLVQKWHARFHTCHEKMEIISQPWSGLIQPALQMCFVPRVHFPTDFTDLNMNTARPEHGVSTELSKERV